MSFVSPSILNVPRGDAEENIKIEGRQNLLFPLEPIIKCLLYLPTQKRK